MVQGEPGRNELASSHHVARYCRRRDIRNDGSVSPAAFQIRPGEEYLSTNWLEYFHDYARLIQIVGARQALADKGFRVSPSASFVALNVGDSITLCRQNLNVIIRFIVLGEAHDPSHTGIFGYAVQNNDAIATQLASSINSNEIYAAAS